MSKLVNEQLKMSRIDALSSPTLESLTLLMIGSHRPDLDVHGLRQSQPFHTKFFIGDGMPRRRSPIRCDGCTR